MLNKPFFLRASAVRSWKGLAFRRPIVKTTALIFYLVLGHADGEDAGEAARANNLGLSFLSYTCIPAEAQNV